MRSVRYLGTLLIFCVVLLAACTRAGSGGISRVVIQAPARHKMSALNLPAGRNACWGINVTANDIKAGEGSACSPTTGVVAGYVDTGQYIKAQVPKGKSRKVDLYAFLLPAGSTDSCPDLATPIPAAQLTETYLMGSVVLDMMAEDTIVEMTAVFPGVANHIAHALAMPATCTAIVYPKVPGVPPVGPGNDRVLIGTSYILRARTGTPTPKRKQMVGTIILETY